MSENIQRRPRLDCPTGTFAIHNRNTGEVIESSRVDRMLPYLLRWAGEVRVGEQVDISIHLVKP